MAALTAEQIIEQERAREYVRSVKHTAEQIMGRRLLEKAFEELGCTCHTDRGRLTQLQEQMTGEVIEQLRAEITRQFTEGNGAVYDEMMRAYGTNYYVEPAALFQRLYAAHPLAQEIQALQYSIHETDRMEHPDLDTQARTSAAFLATWLFEQPREVVGLSHKDIAEKYAVAWMHEGWRPGQKEVE